MSTTAIMKIPVGEILLPESEYELGRVKLRKEVDTFVLHAEEITAIATDEDKKIAVEAGRLLQAVSKKSTEFYKPFKDRINAVKQVILDEENEDKDRIGKQKDRIGILVTKWNQEEERKRQEIERAEREAARKAAEEAQLQEAIALEAEGLKEEAAAVMEAPVMAPPVIAQRAAPQKAAGEVTKTTYSGKVTSVVELVKGIAAGKVPVQAVKIDQGFIDKQAGLLRDGMDWPGVTVEKSVDTHFRS